MAGFNNINLDDAVSGLPKDDKDPVKSRLSATLNQAAKHANGLVIEETDAKKMAQLIQAQKTAGGRTKWDEWTDDKLSFADVKTKGLMPSGVKIYDEPTGKIDVSDLASYVLYGKALSRQKDALTGAEPSIKRLGYDDIAKDVDALATKKIKGEAKDKIAETVSLTTKLKAYGTKAEKYADALQTAKKDSKDVLAAVTSEGLVDKLDEAAKARADVNQAIKDKKDQKDIDDLEKTAKGKETLAARAYRDIVGSFVKDQSKEADLTEAVKHVIHQKLQEEKAAGKFAGWSGVNDKDKQAVYEGTKYSEIAEMLDKTLLEKNLGLEQSKSKYASNGVGNDKEEGKGNGKMALGAIAAGGAALALGAAMTGRDTPADPSTGDPGKKKWGFGRVAATLAGVVVTVAAFMAMTRGTGDTIGEKFKTGLSFGGRA